MKITLVQRIYNIINTYKSALYDTNLAINVVSWFQKLYPSVKWFSKKVKWFSKILPQT